MSEANANKLASLFEETGQAHHRAFEKTDGMDPDWPLWYAGYLLHQHYRGPVFLRDQYA